MSARPSYGEDTPEDERSSTSVAPFNARFTIPHAGTWYEWDPDTGEWVRQ